MITYIKLQIIIFLQIYLQSAVAQIFYEPFAQYIDSSSEFLSDAIYYNNFILVLSQKEGILIYKFDETNDQIKKVDQIVQEGDYISNLQIVNLYNQDYLLVSNASKGICFHDSTQFQQIKCIRQDFTVKKALLVIENYIASIGTNNLQITKIKSQNFETEKLNTWELNDMYITNMQTDPLNIFLFLCDGPYLTIFKLDKLIAVDPNYLVTKIDYSELMTDVLPVVNDQKQGFYVLELVRGLYYVDAADLYANPEKGTYNLPQQLLVNQIWMKGMAVTKNQKQLYLGMRSQGVQIYDIEEDRFNPYLLQVIPAIGSSDIIALTDDETKLIYCNGKNMKVYNKLNPNLSLNIPNFFNTIQSKTVNYSTTLKETTPWRLKITSDQQYFVLAGARNGAQIFSIADPGNPIHISDIPPDQLSNPTDGVTISQDGNLLLIGEGGSGVKIVDITDKKNWNILGQILFPSGDADDMKFALNETHMAVGHGTTGVSFLDINDPTQPTVVSVWNLDTPSGSVESVLVDNQDKYVFASLRYFGVVILKIDTNQPEMEKINEIPVGNTESMLLSNDNKFAYLLDGNVGLRILDVSDINNIIPLHIVTIEGFPGKARHFIYEQDIQYLFVQQQDNGLMACVNITDPYNANMVMKFDIQKEFSYDLDCTQNKNYCYILNDKNIRVLPMKNSIDIHKEFRVINFKDNQIVSEKYEQNSLPIGKYIQVILLPLRVGGNVQINKLYHYSNFYLDVIPNYMKFNKQSLTLDIHVSKDGLEEGLIYQNNIMLVQLSKQILIKNLLYDELGIDSNIAQKIIDESQATGYLDENQYISESFNYLESIFPKYDVEYQNTIFTPAIKTFVKQIFINSLIQVPIALNFQQSLFFLPHDLQGQFIQTVSDQLKIQINILDATTAQFVIQQHTGALVDSQLLILEGNKNLVLQILSNDLKIHLKASSRIQVKLEIILEDGINHKQVIQSDLQECSFINTHLGIQYTQGSFQEQFDKTYPEGIFIDENFFYQFKEITFQSTINLPIEYSILIKTQEDNDFKEPENGSWISYSNQERKVEGIPPISYYEKQFEIKVTTTDKYVQIEDIVVVKVEKIPFILVLNIIVYVGSPIITLLGLIKYRGSIYGIFCKKNYVDGKVFIKDGEEYSLQLILGKTYIELIKPIYSQFYKIYSENPNKLEDQIQMNTGDINIDKISSQMLKIIHANKDYQEKAYVAQGVLKNIQNKKTDQFTYQIIKCLMYQDILKLPKNIKTLQIFKDIIKYLQVFTQNPNQWFSGILKIEYRQVHQQEEKIPLIKFNVLKLHRTLKNIQFFNKTQLDSLDLELFKLQKKYHQYEDILISKNYLENTQHNLYFQVNDQIFLEICQIYQKYNTFKEKVNVILLMNYIICQCLGFQTNDLLRFSYGITLNCDHKDIHTFKAQIKSNRWFVNLFPSLSRMLNIDYQDLPQGASQPLPDWLTCDYHHGIAEIYGVWISNDYKDTEIKLKILNIFNFPMKEFLLVRLHEENIQKDHGERNRHSINEKYLKQIQGLPNTNKNKQALSVEQDTNRSQCLMNSQFMGHNSPSPQKKKKYYQNSVNNSQFQNNQSQQLLNSSVSNQFNFQVNQSNNLTHKNSKEPQSSQAIDINDLQDKVEKKNSVNNQIDINSIDVQEQKQIEIKEQNDEINEKQYKFPDLEFQIKEEFNDCYISQINSPVPSCYRLRHGSNMDSQRLQNIDMLPSQMEKKI